LATSEETGFFSHFFRTTRTPAQGCEELGSKTMLCAECRDSPCYQAGKGACNLQLCGSKDGFLEERRLGGEMISEQSKLIDREEDEIGQSGTKNSTVTLEEQIIDQRRTKKTIVIDQMHHGCIAHLEAG
jgi:hypothetical protein